MGDEGDFGESFRSDDPESQGETETTGEAESTEDVDYQSDVEGPSRFDGPTGGPEGKSGSSTGMIVTVILVLLLIAGVVAYFVIQKQQENNDTTSETELPGGESMRPTMKPETVTCDVGGLPPPDSLNYNIQGDLAKLLEAQNSSSGAHGVFEMDSTMYMPLSAANEANNSFMAIVLPFVEGNLTFFFIYDNCTTNPERVLGLEKSLSDLHEFRTHFSSLAGNATRLTSHKCWEDVLHPAKVPEKTVPVAVYQVKLIVDFAAQTVTLEGCDDSELKTCKRVYHEKVTLYPAQDYSNVQVQFHTGWNDKAQVGTRFYLDDYVQFDAKCLLYPA